MYAEAIETAIEHLIAEVEVVPDQKLLTIGTAGWRTFTAELEHLVSRFSLNSGYHS